MPTSSFLRDNQAVSFENLNDEGKVVRSESHANFEISEILS